MRKIVDGDIRNKEKTKNKLIEAVGKIIATEGYSKLGVNKISKIAEVDKKLIYRYFGNFDELINGYLRKKDFWTNQSSIALQNLESNFDDFGKSVINDLLIDLFDHLDHIDESKKITLLEVTEKSSPIEQLSVEREMLRSNLFKVTDPWFIDKSVDLRACLALILGGIYYLTLHADATGVTFCEINVKDELGRERLTNAITTLINSLYSIK
ncbi:TetR/AcrR family transcriptional regulator [Sphingobacterium detergens]|uniref:TetR family transcriptional regulator n=1 Tax=Sphingobacterium detergens TaxID=1145106 RepID=A0A420B7K9_SPHD1|nr:TetR/AcrR family transcriptional regulator [Sphingobacterium detergens]RKE52744.1 TetR family transcriptional regulator [Sphingobacterium detergens]